MDLRRRLNATTILPAAAAVLLCSGACSSSGQLDNLQAQLSEVDLRLMELSEQSATAEDVATLTAALSEEAEKHRGLEAENADEIRNLTTEIAELSARIDDTLFRLSQLSELMAMTQQQIQDLQSQSDRAGSASELGPLAPDEIYRNAYAAYQEGNYDLAIRGFREYLEKNSDTDLADNALYWIGESYFSQRRFDRAVATFSEVLTRYPASDKSASAMLKSGFAQIESGQKEQGRATLEGVLREHPSSPEAELARRELRGLGTQS